MSATTTPKQSRLPPRHSATRASISVPSTPTMKSKAKLSNKSASPPPLPSVASAAPDAALTALPSLDTPARAAAIARPHTRQWHRLLQQANDITSTSAAVRRSLRDHLDAADRAAAKRAAIHAARTSATTLTSTTTTTTTCAKQRNANISTTSANNNNSTTAPSGNDDPPSPSAISDVPRTPPQHRDDTPLDAPAVVKSATTSHRTTRSSAAALSQPRKSETPQKQRQSAKKKQKKHPSTSPSPSPSPPPSKHHMSRADDHDTTAIGITTDNCDDSVTATLQQQHKEVEQQQESQLPPPKQQHRQPPIIAHPVPAADDADWQHRVAAFNALADMPSAAAGACSASQQEVALAFAPALVFALRDLRSSVVVAAGAAAVAAAPALAAAAAADRVDLGPMLRATLSGAAVTKAVIARANREAAHALLAASRHAPLWQAFIADGLAAGAPAPRRLVLEAAVRLATAADLATPSSVPPGSTRADAGADADAMEGRADYHAQPGATNAGGAEQQGAVQLLTAVAKQVLPVGAVDRDPAVRDLSRELYKALRDRRDGMLEATNEVLTPDARARLSAATATAAKASGSSKSISGPSSTLQKGGAASGAAAGGPSKMARTGGPGAAASSLARDKASTKAKRPGGLAEMIAKRRAAAKKKAAEGASSAPSAAVKDDVAGNDVVTVPFAQ